MGLTAVPAQTGLLQDLSLVGDILAFVQLGTQLLTSSKAFEAEAGDQPQPVGGNTTVSKGGQKAHHLASSAISRCRIYENKFQRRFGTQPYHPAATPVLDLQAICGECYSAARVLLQHLEKTQTREEKRSSRGWSGLKAALVKVWSKKGMHEEVLHLSRIKCSIESETFRSIASNVTTAALKESSGFPEDRELFVALSGGLAPGPDAPMTSTQIRALCLVLSRSAADAADVVSPPLLTDRRPSVFSIAASSCRSSSRRSSISAKNSLFSYSTYGDPLSSSSAGTCFLDESTVFKESRRRIEVSQQLRNELVVDCPPSTRPTTATQNAGSRDGAMRSHHDTYDAILQEPECGLRSWLEEPGDHRVYWIEGSRGSGKSTLMESISTYVCRRGVMTGNDDGDHAKLIVVKFTPSSSPARSQGTPWATELARSMLYEILGQDPSLIPLVFPREWSDAYCKSLGYTSPASSSSSSSSSSSPISATTSTTTLTSNWTFHQLKASIDWLFTQSTIPFRACLLIDSLDEFYEAAVADQGADHADIDEIVRYMIAGQWKNTQCCISTRPSAPVAAAFKGQPALRMAELTRQAMRKYALDQISSYEVFRDMQELDSAVLYQCVNEIVDAADGVFLWTKLAISTVMRGQHAEGFGMQEVQGRIRSLPRRLDDLYQHIVTTKSRQCSQSRRLFRLVAATSRPQENDWAGLSRLSLLELWFALDDDAAMLAVSAPTGYLTQQEMVRRREAMVSKLSQLSGGLIKVVEEGDVVISGGDLGASPSATVAFLNDSVTTAFFATAEAERTTMRTSMFNPNLAILSSLVLSLKTERQNIPRARDRLLAYNRRSDVDNALLYARRAEAELGYNTTLNYVVDALVETAASSHPCWFQLNDVVLADADAGDDHHEPGVGGDSDYTTKHSIALRGGLHQYLRHLLAHDNASSSSNKEPHNTTNAALPRPFQYHPPQPPPPPPPPPHFTPPPLPPPTCITAAASKATRKSATTCSPLPCSPPRASSSSSARTWSGPCSPSAPT
ncbi:hypothetical protein PG988_011661 [Apiospora saccharicola]